ncbi:helix-turn-helix domain-containing protein [Levilactobacillus enshiensis]|uniref:helix-turn-helix domain-containing protein n=1 Tax=Levilactobacillus enshiensis TaxID=2590213 RepID=UPI00117B826A|nr:helix-turn-helix domain-containing protein [Levilactobacillus enshiensis]
MPTIMNGVPWFDQNHELVNSAGGCLLVEHGRYYLFGENRYETKYGFTGFSRYMSVDLEHWVNTGLALGPQSSGLLGSNRIGERVKVMQLSTGGYVMLMHTDDIRGFDPCVGVATAEHLTDAFQFRGPLLFKGDPIRMWHIGAFTDNDGVNYLLTHEGDIYRLATNGLSVVAKVADNIAPGTEAPALFYQDGHYFFLASRKTSWERNDNIYCTADHLTGPWTYRGIFCPPLSRTYDSQCAYVTFLPTDHGLQPVYLGDRRSFPHQASATHVWLPLTVNGLKLSIPNYWTAWDWQVGKPVPAKPIPLAWTETLKGASMTLTFRGRGITLWGRTGIHSGYALVSLTTATGKRVQHARLDFYSQLDQVNPCYASGRLPLDDYRLTIQVEGTHGDWYDKSRRHYGSDGNRITVTGYQLMLATNLQADISYQTADFPFMITSLRSQQLQISDKVTTTDNQYVWLQSDTGTGELTLAGRKVYLPAGSGVLIGPKMTYSCQKITTFWQTSTLMFNGEAVADMLPEMMTAVWEAPVLSSHSMAFIRKKQPTWLAAQRRRDIGSQLVYEFLLLLKPLLDSRMTATTSMQNIAIRVLQTIRNHYRDELTNQRLADVTNYSIQYMLQAFHETYRTTPRRVLAVYRVKQAKQLLLEQPDLPLTKIASECGFSSETYLIRAFKEQEGVTPGKFRQDT